MRFEAHEEEKVVHMLKHWAEAGRALPSRKEHQAPSIFAQRHTFEHFFEVVARVSPRFSGLPTGPAAPHR